MIIYVWCLSSCQKTGGSYEHFALIESTNHQGIYTEEEN